MGRHTMLSQQSKQSEEVANIKYTLAKIFIVISAAVGVFMLGNLGYEYGRHSTENKIMKGGLIANGNGALDVESLKYYCDLQRYVGGDLPERCGDE